jgi:protein-disulfide isomerase
MYTKMIKSKINYILYFLLKVFIIYIAIFFNSYADDSLKKNKLIAIGTNNAPVKIKIFSSLTCPHCASLHINIISKIKKKYVSSNKVQLIFIDFPLDQAAFNASKILHCVDQNKQIDFLDIIYKNQDVWTASAKIEEINNNLKDIVKSLGISSFNIDACLNNEAIADKILNDRINGHKKYSINSTPTIIINEKKFEGSVTFESIQKKIEKII